MQQSPVVGIIRVFQVGIGNENLSHVWYYIRKAAKGKVVGCREEICLFGIFRRIAIVINQECLFMGFMRDVEIVWDDLLDAFQNSDLETVYFLDRELGEIFSVPLNYEDDDFWNELEMQDDRYLRIPDFDNNQKWLLFNQFLKGVTSESLRGLLQRLLSGKVPHGRLDEILSFYPEEKARLHALKEELTTERIRSWLELNDIYLASNSL